MHKPAGKTLNVLRWIFGIPLAFLIAFGFLYLLVTFDTQPRGYGFSFSFVFSVLAVIFIFGVPVFLSCLITPSPKKYASLISVSLITVFTIALFIYLLIINPPFQSARQAVVVVGRYMIFIAGSSAGFAVSYAVFKNKGWERKPKGQTIDELD